MSALEMLIKQQQEFTILQAKQQALFQKTCFEQLGLMTHQAITE